MCQCRRCLAAKRNVHAQPNTIAAAAANLQAGPMTRQGSKYIGGGRRLFNAATINTLIADGIAVRIGNGVVSRKAVEKLMEEW